MNLENIKIIDQENTKKEMIPYSKYTVSALSKKNLSTNANRIIRLVASQIMPYHEDYHKYTIDIPSFASYFGLSNAKIHTTLRKALIELNSTQIVLEIGRGRITNIISSAQIYENTIEIVIDPQLKPIYASINNVMKYPQKYIRGFISSYTFSFYEYFLLILNDSESIEFEIDIEELKKTFSIPQSYKYAEMKRRIIIPVIDDINCLPPKSNKSFQRAKFQSLDISFEEVKTGRKITSLIFKVKRLNNDLLNSPKNELLASLTEKQKKAYEYFINLGVNQKIILDSIQNYSPEALIEIYENTKININNAQNKAAYAASCLINGYKKFHQDKPMIAVPENINEDQELYDRINIYINSLTQEEKQLEIIKLLKKETTLSNSFFNNLGQEKTWEEILHNPLLKSLLVKFLRENPNYLQ